MPDMSAQTSASNVSADVKKTVASARTAVTEVLQSAPANLTVLELSPRPAGFQPVPTDEEHLKVSARRMGGGRMAALS
jgi:hypothetical protein